MPKYILTVCLFILFSAQYVFSQTNAKIKQLEKQRTELQKQIEASEQMLKSTSNDVSSQLKNLSLLNSQIAERKKYVNLLNNDIRSIDGEIKVIDGKISKLEDDLVKTKKKYAQSLRYMRSNRGIQEKLLFIFSAQSLQHLYRRLRYVREYSTYQRLQGDEIMKQQKELLNKKEEKKSVLLEKKKVLEEIKSVQQKLEEQEKEQQTLINSLKKKQANIRKEINKQKQKANKLNSQIDRLVQIEIEKARKRAEEERKARERAAAKKSGSEKTSKMEAFKLSSEDRALSSNFEKNKGILPIPVTGPYAIVNHYGQYNVPGLRNVQLDNKGVDIQAHPGAMARAIFGGEVSAVFEYGGLKGVLIRHGDYISVYCNLSSVLVKQGDKVSVKQAIGKIFSNSKDGNRTILHFQLRKETTKLNPEVWLDD